jgi:GWxTD domain-containing protein
MRRVFNVMVFLVVATVGVAQPLRDINYQYLYNPVSAYRLRMVALPASEKHRVYYEFALQTAAQNINDYTITWEGRTSLADKTAVEEIHTEDQQISETRISGTVRTDQPLLVARVTYVPDRKNFVHYISTAHSGSLHLVRTDGTVTDRYVKRSEVVRIKSLLPDTLFFLSHYAMDFPPAAPPFSVNQLSVAKRIVPDTLWRVPAAAPLSLPDKGLYLVQSDTSSASGLAFRIEGDYPRLATLESLVAPLTYVCTNSEIDRLAKAGDDKKQFDKIILSIAGNTERASVFMRNYFRRVEQANSFFTSYKEGWKTDRGMIYIVYGAPTAVYLLGDREVWEYSGVAVQEGSTSLTLKERFTFVKSSTLFDPENFVLLRDKKYKDNWYSLIDLWRKARL